MAEHQPSAQPDDTSGNGHAHKPVSETPSQLANLSDLLQELRVLLQGVQVLTGFLIVLPFYQGFGQLDPIEKGIYLATFACSIVSLIIFSAPAAQHRLEWPLRDRGQFKRFATRMIILGLVPSSLALALTAQLIVAQILGVRAGFVGGAFVLAIVGALWWLVPLEAIHRRNHDE